jgi:rubrerythrin
MKGPWTLPEARSALRSASTAQREVEKQVRAAYRDFAVKEETYRKALALEIVRLLAEDEVAWTAANDLARGDKKVAHLRMERDIAEGVKEAITQAAWRRNQDRKDAQRFAEWSMRREIAEFHGEDPDTPTYPAAA